MLYLVAAAAGVPLVAWFLLGGADEGGDSGGGADDSFGGVMLRLLPLSSVALAVATFGVTGVALGLAGASSVTTLLAAVLVGLAAGALNSTAFAYLRRSESTSSLEDHQFVGSTGRVVMPVGDGRRGRIAVSLGNQQRYLSAQSLPGEHIDDELEVGSAVLIVDLQAGVASVTRLDPELS